MKLNRSNPSNLVTGSGRCELDPYSLTCLSVLQSSSMTLNHLILFATLFAPCISQAQTKPNIILIFPDNLGVGEVSSYGGARGVPTPNIDRIGNEGIRLTNFN